MRKSVKLNSRIFLIAIVIAVCGIDNSIAQAPPPLRNELAIFELTRPVQEPRNFNPYAPAGRRDHGAHQAMWEPLFQLNYETGQLEPWLALSLTPANPTIPEKWTLKLRPGVFWSDNKPFTSTDVVFTLNMLLKNDVLVSQDAIAVRQHVKPDTVTAADPLTVTFELNKPNPRAQAEIFANGFFTSLVIVPEHIWKVAVAPANLPKLDEFKFSNPIGTGPYILKNSGDASETRVLWTRNDNWWGIKPVPLGPPPPAGSTAPAFKTRLPAPKFLEWRVLGSEEQSKAALEKDELDAGRELPLAKLRDAQSVNVKIIGWDATSPLAWNDPCVRQIDINTKRQVEVTGQMVPGPWSDPALRRAASMLIDRSALAASVHEGAALPARTLFPEYGSLKAINDAIAAQKLGVNPNPDVAAAGKLLTDAGWTKVGAFYQKDGQNLAATIHVVAGAGKDTQLAREVAAQLTAAGIEATTREVSSAEYWAEDIPKGKFEMALSWLSCGSVAEPYSSLARHAAAAVPIGVRSPGFNNVARWDKAAAPDFEKVVNTELGARMLVPATVPPIVVRAYKHLSDEMPIIPLLQSPRIIPFNTKYWTGWPVKGGPGVPMHSWSATHRIIHALEKAP